MNSLPLVSIVLPTYNGARYLAESIESCIAQTYPHWELIVVDDCSTDKTPSIINDYARKDARIRGTRLVRNSKLPAALNSGFRLAHGEYLTWTSDDNLYEPMAIEILKNYLDEHTSVGLVYTDLKIIDEIGAIVGTDQLEEPEALARGNCIQACFMYRRQVQQRVGEYAVDMFLVEDYEYWLRIARSFDIHHIRGMSPYKYRRHSASLTATRRADVLVQLGRARARHASCRNEAREILEDAYYSAIWPHRAAGNRGKALKCALHCLSIRPFFLRNWKVSATGICRLLLRA